jgi:hypothetical protein
MTLFASGDGRPRGAAGERLADAGESERGGAGRGGRSGARAHPGGTGRQRYLDEHAVTIEEGRFASDLLDARERGVPTVRAVDGIGVELGS